MGVIYVRPNLINGKKYVGQATNLKKRQNDWNCLAQPYAGPAINAARAKYGIEAFGFEILKECNDNELDYWEKYYVKELNTKAPYGYNLTDGGGGMSGYTLSEETRKKMSEIQKGKNNGFYGKHHSEETRKKMSEIQKGKNNGFYGKHLSKEQKKKISEANKGKTPWNKGKTNIYSEETRKKMSEIKKGKQSWIKGKHWSEETRKKMSEKAKGRKVTEETRKKLSENHKGKYNTKCSKPILQINRYTNEVIAEFPSIIQVQRDFGYDNGAISKCCKGKLKSAYNFIWRYKESVA